MKIRETKWSRRLLDPEEKTTKRTTVHQLLQERRRENSLLAQESRHRRAVQAFGDDGLRCPECQDVPLHPWEPVYSRDEFGATFGEPR